MSVTERKTEAATTIDPTLTKSPSKEETSVKEPSSFSKSPVTSMISSEDIDDETSSVVPIKKTVQAPPPAKAKVDYTKRCNNVSIKYLRLDGVIFFFRISPIFSLVSLGHTRPKCDSGVILH